MAKHLGQRHHTGGELVLNHVVMMFLERKECKQNDMQTTHLGQASFACEPRQLF